MNKRLKEEPVNVQSKEQYSRAKIQIRTLIYEAEQKYFQKCMKKSEWIKNFMRRCEEYNEHHEIRDRKKNIRNKENLKIQQDQDICNHFNNFFSGIGEAYVSAVHKTDEFEEQDVQKQNSFYVFPTDI